MRKIRMPGCGCAFGCFDGTSSSKNANRHRYYGDRNCCLAALRIRSTQAKISNGDSSSPWYMNSHMQEVCTCLLSEDAEIALPTFEPSQIRGFDWCGKGCPEEYIYSYIFVLTDTRRVHKPALSSTRGTSDQSENHQVARFHISCFRPLFVYSSSVWLPMLLCVYPSRQSLFSYPATSDLPLRLSVPGWCPSQSTLYSLKKLLINVTLDTMELIGIVI